MLPHCATDLSAPRVLGATLILSVVLLAAMAGPVGAAGVDPQQGRQWGLATIGATQAWSTGRGDGIVIAIVDTGVDPAHEDLAAKIVAGRDIVDNDNDPRDQHGHGTHVAGIAAAISGNGRGGAGVAPGAAIMPVRVLDHNGDGSSADVVAGVRWAVDNGADVVDLSLGVPGQQVLGTGLAEVVRYAWNRGVITVVAAGNDYVLSSGFADEPAVVVSATTRSDEKPDYSSGVGAAHWGIAAPGGGCTVLFTCPLEDDVLSTWWAPGAPNAYAYSAGTSMAAPHVAAAAAILRGLGLNPQQTVERLLATAADLGAAGRDNTYGAGRLDLAAAVAGLGPGTTTSPPPGPSSPDPQPDPATPSRVPPQPQGVAPPPTGVAAHPADQPVSADRSSQSSPATRIVGGSRSGVADERVVDAGGERAGRSTLDRARAGALTTPRSRDGQADGAGTVIVMVAVIVCTAAAGLLLVRRLRHPASTY